MTAPKVGDRVRVAELTGHVDSIAGAYAELTLEAAGMHDIANLPLHALTVIHPPVRVGDVIDTAEQLDALPAHAIVCPSSSGHMVQRDVDGRWLVPGDAYRYSTAHLAGRGATVIYLPDGAA